jgi:integrase
MKTYPLPIYMQRFFTERLATQLLASPNTVASYRDTFRLLLKYAAERLKRQPTQLKLADLDADLIGGFLSFVEARRGNGARSRNARLSAIRSFFKYVAVNEPEILLSANKCWPCHPNGMRNGRLIISPAWRSKLSSGQPIQRPGPGDEIGCSFYSRCKPGFVYRS